MCHLLGPSFGLALQSSIVFLGLWWHQISEPNQLSRLKGHWFQLPPNIWRLMTYPEKSDFSPKSWSIEHICHPSSLPFLRSLALMRVEIGFLMRCWCSIATFEFWHEFVKKIQGTKKIRESLFTFWLSSADISLQFDDFFEENSKILSRIWDFQKWLENVKKHFFFVIHIFVLNEAKWNLQIHTLIL